MPSTQSHQYSTVSTHCTMGTVASMHIPANIACTIYCIAQNFGGENFGKFGEWSVICQYFTQPNPINSYKVLIGSHIHQIFPRQHFVVTNLPKFYPARILRYTVIPRVYNIIGESI